MAGKHSLEAERMPDVRKVCPSCGSEHIHVGCPYQDCDVCEDVETSWCLECGLVWGGAEYWL